MASAWRHTATVARFIAVVALPSKGYKKLVCSYAQSGAGIHARQNGTSAVTAEWTDWRVFHNRSGNSRLTPGIYWEFCSACRQRLQYEQDGWCGLRSRPGHSAVIGFFMSPQSKLIAIGLMKSANTACTIRFIAPLSRSSSSSAFITRPPGLSCLISMGSVGSVSKLGRHASRVSLRRSNQTRAPMLDRPDQINPHAGYCTILEPDPSVSSKRNPCLLRATQQARGQTRAWQALLALVIVDLRDSKATTNRLLTRYNEHYSVLAKDSFACQTSQTSSCEHVIRIRIAGACRA